MVSIIVLVMSVIIYAHWAVEAQGTYTYNSTKEIPQKKVGLLLGTSKSLVNGRKNLFFKYRIEAAFALWKTNKLKYLIISGDHSEKYYNEPEDMKKELMALGVPDTAIVLDYAGLRTYDSVVRCKKIFGQDDFIIISQRFHNERALYIAHHMDIKAIAYNSKEPTVAFGFKTYLREYLARVRVVIDVILKNDPKFLGPEIKMK